MVQRSSSKQYIMAEAPAGNNVVPCNYRIRITSSSLSLKKGVLFSCHGNAASLGLLMEKREKKRRERKMNR